MRSGSTPQQSFNLHLWYEQLAPSHCLPLQACSGNSEPAAKRPSRAACPCAFPPACSICITRESFRLEINTLWKTILEPEVIQKGPRRSIRFDRFRVGFSLWRQRLQQEASQQSSVLQRGHIMHRLMLQDPDPNKPGRLRITSFSCQSWST